MKNYPEALKPFHNIIKIKHKVALLLHIMCTKNINIYIYILLFPLCCSNCFATAPVILASSSWCESIWLLSRTGKCSGMLQAKGVLYKSCEEASGLFSQYLLRLYHIVSLFAFFFFSLFIELWVPFITEYLSTRMHFLFLYKQRNFFSSLKAKFSNGA